MKVLIIEDEELAAERLRDMVQTMKPDVEIVACTTSIKSSTDWLKSNPQPDVILMDIELSDGQSFEIFNQVTIESAVIFTTSYDEFAIKAFKVNSVDYLLKPVLKEDLKKAFDKYQKLHNRQPISNDNKLNVQHLIGELKVQLRPVSYRKRFLVKHGQKHLPIEVDAIAYFFVADRIIFFKTLDNKKYIVDFTIDELETMLDPAFFFRINRSLLIGIKSIQQLHSYVNSRLLVTLQPAFDVPAIVSREKVNEFKNWIGR